VAWNMPRGAPLETVDAFVTEAKRMGGAAPTIIGYGMTSDPIREVSYDSLFAAIQTSIRQPWTTINVDQANVNVKDGNGFVERTMKLNATGEVVTERVTINEEVGEITFNKCNGSGQPGSVERVLAIHSGPLRIEFFQRNAADLMRSNWTAPASIARTTFENIVKSAKKLESKSSAVIGLGLASKPMSGLTQDSVWKAMLFSVRNPDK